MLSIVVPTLNEATDLPRIVGHVRQMAAGDAVEIIVSDCISSDGTADIAEGLTGVHIVRGSTCRAEAMNRGASLARGKFLLFLHADTLLPRGFTTMIAHALKNPHVVGGAFDFQFARDCCSSWRERRSLDVVVLCNRLRFRWTGNFYGDQGIFCHRHVFENVGGFPLVHIMEDIRFCQKLKRRGRTAILQPGVVTSPRRFLSRGVLRQLGRDLVLLGYESCGLGTPRLYAAYNEWNRRNVSGASALSHPADGSRGSTPGATS